MEAAKSIPEEATSQKAQGVRRNVLLNLRGYSGMPEKGSPAVQRCQKTLSNGCVTTQKGKDALEKEMKISGQLCCHTISETKLKKQT